MTWQPIETAPKDGTRILVFFVFGGRDKEIIPVKWNPKPNYHPWRDAWGIGAYSTKFATHWMPMPEPPEGK